jgi:Mg-chelatase subunit ChlI
LVQLRQLQQKLFTLAQQLQQRLGAMGATNEMGQDTGADAGTDAGRSALADTGNSNSNSHNGLPLPELARKEDQMRIAAAALEKRQQEEETKPQETKQPEQKQQKQQEQKQTTQKPSKQEEREEEGEEREEKKEGETKTGDAQAETPTSGGGDLYEERLANERYEVELMKKKLQLEMARISQMSNTMQSMVGGDGMNMQHMPQMGDMSGTLSLLGWCHCLLLWPLVVVVAATIGVRLTS